MPREQGNHEVVKYERTLRNVVSTARSVVRFPLHIQGAIYWNEKMINLLKLGYKLTANSFNLKLSKGLKWIKV